jgi:hypothetical protein
MTLQQLSVVKQWHVRHHRTVELHLWDAVLTLWLLGWLGLGAQLVLSHFYPALASAVLLTVPGGYVWLRRRLHASGRVRCDWLVALRR